MAESKQSIPNPVANPLDKELAQPLSQEEIQRREIERKRALLSKVIAGRQALMDKGRVRMKDGSPLNPSIHYSWVNTHESRVTFYKAQGYQVVNDPNVVTDWLREDGTHVYGDLILMQLDQEVWEMNKLYSQMQAVQGVEGEEVFKAFAERAGIPVQMPKS